MLAILNSLNAHNLPIFQPILMIFLSKFMLYRALSDKTYLSLGLLSPLRFSFALIRFFSVMVYCISGIPGFFGIWGERLFIFRDLGSTGNYTQKNN